MKKINSILLYILGISFLFVACNPMEDIYKELDKEENPYKVVVDYKLVNEDYTAFKDLAKGDPVAANIAKYKNFSSSAPASKYLPIFLSDFYPHLEKGSIATVTYKEYIGGLGYLNTLAKAKSYTISNDDYVTMGTGPGKYKNFSDKDKPEDYLPEFFKNKYPEAKKNDYVYVTYKFYSDGVSERSDYYMHDGSEWGKVSVEVPKGVTAYTLSNEDYDSMGSGPGKYNNFSGTVNPEDYLPTFLKLKFPYAKSGDRIAVVYAYYIGSGKTETRADEYTLVNNVWEKSKTAVSKTSQFIHIGAKGWIFDPSVVFTMAKEDYQIIVENVKGDSSKEETSSHNDSEYYYGSSSHYSNFDIRDGKISSKFTDWKEAVKEAIGDVLLPTKFPNAKKEVDGVQVKYKVTCVTYDGSSDTYQIIFDCTKSGPNPEFEYVEGFKE